MEELTNTLAEIKNELVAIHSLLQRLPEIQAAAYIELEETYRLAQPPMGLGITRAKDIWELCPPNLR